MNGDGDRQIMQKSQGRKKDNISKIRPSILEEGNKAKESATSANDDTSVEDLELVQGGESETSKDKAEEKQIEDLGGSPN